MSYLNNKRISNFDIISFTTIVFVLLIYYPFGHRAYSEEVTLEKHVMPKPYFLLVNSSYQNQLDKLDVEKIKVLNDSPYHGITVRIINEFDDKPFDFESLKKKAEFVKNNTSKQIWPWIFLNRIIGTNEKDNIRDVIKDKPYFLKIKGMDIYDEAGTLSDFYNLWRISLKLAKNFSSPGVVFDMEPYNNFKVYKVDYLKESQNKSNEEIKKHLKIIGSNLTVIAQEEYPEAIVWFLFTYLGYQTSTINPFSEKEYMTVSYIAEGMILEAKKRNLPMKFIDGGEVGLGYCYSSLEDMKYKIQGRQDKLKSVLCEYNKLYLGGTIAPWNNIKLKRGWMAEKICGKSPSKTIEDFIPYIRILSTNYDYIWIYATNVAGYDAFDKEISSQFNRGLEKIFRDKSRE
ncbi:MAG: hypothetical protein HS132_00100 [Planctomycetia bacterium]|nr:hypothetical protein [Planctomycetia bacterium]